MTLREIVEDYLRTKAPAEKKYIRYYQEQKSWNAALEKSVLAKLPSGKRFSHQRRIPHKVLTQSKEALSKIDFERCLSFDDLYELINQTSRDIKGFGELAIYDTAHRLGAFLKLKPKFIYLHAGARIGAKALGFDKGLKKLSMDMLPIEFHKLEPEQVEDCLCIYKSELISLRGKIPLPKPSTVRK